MQPVTTAKPLRTLMTIWTAFDLSNVRSSVGFLLSSNPPFKFLPPTPHLVKFLFLLQQKGRLQFILFIVQSPYIFIVFRVSLSVFAVSPPNGWCGGPHLLTQHFGAKNSLEYYI